MAGIQLERDTSWLLEQWARWARSNSELQKISYPGIQPFAKLLSKRGPSALLITEDDAMQIDNALSRLSRRDEEMARVTVLYYWLNQNASLTSRILNLRRARVDVLASAGTAWIDAILAN